MKKLLEWLIDISDRSEDMFDEEGLPTDEWNNLISMAEMLLRRSQWP